jgi:outer membrane protein assembly factor BamA
MASSCRSTRYVPQDKYLLNRSKIESNVKHQGESELKKYLKQRPNSRSLGLFRLRLGLYNISGRDTTKKINKFFRNKIGEAPVIYDSILSERSCLELKKYLQNKGYANAAVDYSTKIKGKKKINIRYHVEGNKPYTLRNFTKVIHNTTIRNLITQDSVNSLIKPGMLFDIDVLNNERQRITDLLKQQGFYYFNKEYINYLADSTLTTNQVDLRMLIRPATRTEADGRVVTVPQRQYTVRNISFFTSYDPVDEINTSALDSTEYENYKVYFSKKPDIRPKVLIDNCHIQKNALYDESQVEKTYSSLNLLSAVKYVNISFSEVSPNSDTLDCLISISPAVLQSYSIDVEGTNTTGDFGFAGNIGYQHRNLFKGSEFFKISLRFAYEAYTANITDLLRDNSTEIGAQTSLTFPSFLFPFLHSDFRRKIRASTEFNLNFNVQNRPEYDRNLASLGMRYYWSTQNTKRHSLAPIDINYVYFPYFSPSFIATYLNSNSVLRHSYDNQLIVSSNYSLNISNISAQKYNNISSRFSFETAGNVLSGISALFKFKKVDDSYTIGNIKFAQYVKGDFDFSFDQYIDYRNNIVYHIGLGIGFPYGNSAVLPFEKRFISGGANSVRGWSVRTLGPGTYKSKELKTIDLNQSGDIQLDLNIEYRFKMYWVLEGALFADAGNIWTIANYLDQEGGVFKFNEFYKQIALSYGLGIRFDFNYFLIRLDMGIKAYNPALEINKWRFKGVTWRNDFSIHIAVGYPF